MVLFLCFCTIDIVLPCTAEPAVNQTCLFVFFVRHTRVFLFAVVFFCGAVTTPSAVKAARLNPKNICCCSRPCLGSRAVYICYCCCCCCCCTCSSFCPRGEHVYRPSRAAVVRLSRIDKKGGRQNGCYPNRYTRPCRYTWMRGEQPFFRLLSNLLPFPDTEVIKGFSP